MAGEIGAEAFHLGRRSRSRSPAGDRPEMVAEPARQQPLLLGVLRNDLRLALVNDLQLVLDVAQEEVRLREARRFAAVEEPQVRQGAQRGERRATAQPLIPAPVDELQRLGDELDLANSAGSELDVAVEPFPRSAAVDLALHRLDLLDGVEVEKAPVDERRDLLEKRPAEVAVAGDRTRLQHRRSLPCLAQGLVVGDRAAERVDDRAVLTFGPQPQVDPEHEALPGDLAERRA